MTSDVREKELEILESIYTSSVDIHQRALAEIVGLSLGMTNSILKRLVQKGLLTIRKVNNRNIRYIVSPKGIEVITRKSYRFFKRTIKNVALYKQTIEDIVHDVKHHDFGRLVLVGASDLDFIVEHACARYGIEYVKNDELYTDQLFYMFSETYIPDDEERDRHPEGSVIFLQDVLMGLVR